MLLPILIPGAAAAVSAESRELDEVLRELRQIEAQIERYLIEQAEGPARPQSRQSPASPASPAPEAPAPTSQEDLEAWGLGVSSELQAVARARVEARAQLDGAESGLKLSSTLLINELEREKTDPAMMLTLALMQARHRASANLAVEQLLRLEQVRVRRRPQAAQDQATPVEPAPEPEALPKESDRLDELRRRHREISARLSELSAGLEETRPPALQFREQRAQLNALMARLSRDEADGPAALPTADSGSGAETRAAPARPAVEDQDGRRIFWRASRAKIHALKTGKVLFAGPFAGYRHLLILDHGEGWTSLYGNMTECYVRVDDVLSKGSVLGEYQAEAIGDPEPFWVEVRRGPEPAPIEKLPGIGEDTREAIFGDTAH